MHPKGPRFDLFVFIEPRNDSITAGRRKSRIYRQANDGMLGGTRRQSRRTTNLQIRVNNRYHLRRVFVFYLNGKAVWLIRLMPGYQNGDANTKMAYGRPAPFGDAPIMLSPATSTNVKQAIGGLDMIRQDKKLNGSRLRHTLILPADS
jgi:hypothetical protein